MMTPVNNIGSGLPADQVRQQDRVNTRKGEKVPESTGSGERIAADAAKDSVDISPAALRLAEESQEVARFQQILRSIQEEERPELDQVRARIVQGEFNRPEVIEQVAGAIASLPPFAEFAEADNVDASAREAQIAAVQQRVESGQYDSDRVIQQVASNILRDIGVS
ncbi:hypothetical protein ACFL6E_02580 [Candidatus Neomarinimicrobiota bacterium]